MMQHRKKNQSDAQKRAYKKYSGKTKPVSLMFSPRTMHRYNQLKEYTDKTGKSINGFIIELISEFFDNGYDKTERKQVEETVPKNWSNTYTTYYADYIDDKHIQYLNDNFGSSTTEKLLDNLYSVMDEYLDEIIETYGTSFQYWVDELPDKIEDGDVKVDDSETVVRNLVNDMLDYVEPV